MRAAIARPIPRLAPVTTTVLPVSGTVTFARSSRRGPRSPLLVPFVERLGVGGLVVTELFAALVRQQVERIREVVVGVWHHAGLARERRLGLIVLDVEHPHGVALLEAAVRA